MFFLFFFFQITNTFTLAKSPAFHRLNVKHFFFSSRKYIHAPVLSKGRHCLTDNVTNMVQKESCSQEYVQLLLKRSEIQEKHIEENELVG